MENIFPTHLLDILATSVSFSFILMTLVQKFKTLSLIKKSSYVWFLNLIFAFVLGVPFGMCFYHFTLYDSLWVSIFGFIGAPSIYNALKNQTILTYKPASISDTITVSKENEIPR